MRPAKTHSVWDDRLDAVLPLAGALAAFIILMRILVL
jgi:hypothetical protein